MVLPLSTITYAVNPNQSIATKPYPKANGIRYLFFCLSFWFNSFCPSVFCRSPYRLINFSNTSKFSFGDSDGAYGKDGEICLCLPGGGIGDIYSIQILLPHERFWNLNTPIEWIVCFGPCPVLPMRNSNKIVCRHSRQLFYCPIKYIFTRAIGSIQNMGVSNNSCAWDRVCSKVINLVIQDSINWPIFPRLKASCNHWFVIFAQMCHLGKV